MCYNFTGFASLIPSPAQCVIIFACCSLFYPISSLALTVFPGRTLFMAVHFIISFFPANPPFPCCSTCSWNSSTPEVALAGGSPWRCCGSHSEPPEMYWCLTELQGPTKPLAHSQSKFFLKSLLDIAGCLTLGQLIGSNEVTLGSVQAIV